jgi:hypothetical protein
MRHVSTYLRTVEHDWRGDHGGAGIYPRPTWGMPCMAISAFLRPGRTADPNDRISKEPSCHLHIKQKGKVHCVAGISCRRPHVRPGAAALLPYPVRAENFVHVMRPGDIR